jgi:hypothetical protein
VSREGKEILPGGRILPAAKGLATKSHETTRKDLLRKWLSATAWSHGSHGLTRIKNINKF